MTSEDEKNLAAKNLADVIFDELLDLGHFGFQHLEEIHAIVEGALNKYFDSLEGYWPDE
jgi:hypothetical protein